MRGRGADNPDADLLDEFRREREEVAWLEQPEARVPPAQERFDAPAVAATQVDDRLIAKGQLSAQQRDRDLTLPDRKIGRL